MQRDSALPQEDPIQEDTDLPERLLVYSELQTRTTRSSHQQPLILLNRQKFLIKWGKSHNHSHEENDKDLTKSWPLTSFTNTGRSRICLEKKNFACLFSGVAWWSCSSKITESRLPGGKYRFSLQLKSGTCQKEAHCTAAFPSWYTLLRSLKHLVGPEEAACLCFVFLKLIFWGTVSCFTLYNDQSRQHLPASLPRELRNGGKRKRSALVADFHLKKAP